MRTRKRLGLFVVLLGLALALPPRFTRANAGPAPAAGTPIVYYGSDGDDVQTTLGTQDPDIIVHFGRAGNDTLYIAGQSHNDWLVQYGGDGQDNLSIMGGDGDDQISQRGGNGGDTQFIEGGGGDDRVYQGGGPGGDTLFLRGDIGNDYFYQCGGTGDDSLNVDAGDDNDRVGINGGSGNDAITYSVSQGDDQVFIDGGTGSDTVMIDGGAGGVLPFTVLDAWGVVLYQRGTGGSVITVRNAECLQVLGPDGEVLYEQGCTSWNPFFSGTGYGSPGRVAVDGIGNIYIVGTSSANWGQNPVRAFQGGSDAFVAKVNASGVLQWVTFLGGTEQDRGNGIAISGSDVFVVGTSDATWGQNPVRAFQGGFSDAFVAKLDAASGILQWHTFLGGADRDEGNGIALDTIGNVYLTGTSSATWGTTVPRPFSGVRDAFVAKLSAANGVLQWNTFLGGVGIDEGAYIATDASGNVYVVGSSTDGWGESPVRAYSAGQDAFAVKLDTYGALQWHTFLGGAGEDRGYAIIATAGGDSIYAAGSSVASWGAPLRAYSAWEDGFVVKLNGSGVLQWNTFLGGEWNDRSDGLALDTVGNLYVKGRSDSAWGEPVSDYNAGYDAYVVKLSPAGAMQMLAFVGGEGDDFGDGIAVDGSGNIILAGMSDAVWGEPVQSYGDTPHAFAVKLNAGGTLQWHTFLGGTPWVTAHATGNGSGSINSHPEGISFNYPENTSVSASFDHGTDVLLRATASTGSTVAWTTCSGIVSGNGTTQATCTFSNLDIEKTAEARFTLNQYTLTVTKTGTGSGTVNARGCTLNWNGNTGTCTADHGTSIILSATANTGSTFTGWSNGTGSASSCTGTGNCIFTITQNSGVTATFTSNQYTITTSANPSAGGSVTCSPNPVNYGSSSTCAITPSTGYHVVDVKVDGVSQGVITSYTFTNVTSAHTIDATFALNTYTLTVTKSGTGSGTVTSDPSGISCGSDCSEAYNQGSAVTLTASPSSGTIFGGWGGDCSSCGTNATCQIIMNSDKTCSAVFDTSAGQYTLTVTRSGTGTGTVTSSPEGISCGSDCSEAYSAGTTVTLTATPDTGSVFSGWSGDCSGSALTTTVTMDGDKTCTATFSPASGPDLTGSWDRLAHTCKNTRSGPKCKLSGTLRVENRGDQAAPPGALVYFYLSSDGTWDSGDSLLSKQVAVGALKAGRSKTRKLSYALPLGESAQGKYVIAWIDATGAVAETNEANNIIVSEELQ